MNFSQFKGRWPFSGSATSKHTLRDLAEEVSFEEVDETPKKTEIDKKTRSEQISKAIMDKTSELIEKNPLAALLVMTFFSAGATWSDEHPVSDYSNSTERTSAMRTEVTTMLDGANTGGDSYFRFDALCYALFADGVLWADKHPAPTVSK